MREASVMILLILAIMAMDGCSTASERYDPNLAPAVGDELRK